MPGALICPFGSVRRPPAEPVPIVSLRPREGWPTPCVAPPAVASYRAYSSCSWLHLQDMHAVRPATLFSTASTGHKIVNATTAFIIAKAVIPMFYQICLHDLVVVSHGFSFGSPSGHASGSWLTWASRHPAPNRARRSA